MPGLRFFSKMSACDIFVYLDDVQYEKREYQNRNKIKNAKGFEYITVPVLTKNRYRQKICDVEINNSYDWRKEHLAKIKTNYSKARFFKKFYPKIEQIYLQESQKMIEVSLKFIDLFRNIMGIDTPYRFSSEFSLNLKSSQRLAEICKLVNANEYLSGQGGKNYLDLSFFEKNKIKVLWQDFKIKPYPQLYGGFLPDLSVIDLIFNCAEKSRQYL